MASTGFLALCLMAGAHAADFDVYYVNVEGENTRAECMDRQIEAIGKEPRRWPAVKVKTCGNSDDKTSATGANLKACFEKQGAGDCVKNGMENRFLIDYDIDQHRMKSSESVRNHILSNTCSHKRLFDQIANDNSSKPYALILEDDAVLSHNFLTSKVTDFIDNYKGKYANDWQLVQLDPYGNHCEEHIIGKHAGRNVMLPRNLWKQAPGMDKPVKGGRTCSQYFGAQALLVRKSEARSIVEHMDSNKAFPMDWIAAELPRGLAWTAGVAQNPRKFRISLKGKNKQFNALCSKDVLKSSINTENKKAEKPEVLSQIEGMPEAEFRVEMEDEFEELEDLEMEEQKVKKNNLIQRQ